MPADARQAPAVTGTLVFAEDHYGRIASAELPNPTHDGVYDIDFQPFGFTTRDARHGGWPVQGLGVATGRRASPRARGTPTS